MWPLYALIGMVCFASMQLVFKQTTRGGLTPATVLFFVFGFGWILYLLHVAVTRTPLALTPSRVGLLFLAGVFAYIGNLYAVRAVAEAPNPGYAMALVGLQALVVTIVSVVLFGATFSWMKAAGVVLCLAGVSLLVSK
jgi:drug/metabolite transporter (DMT)-like permease